MIQDFIKINELRTALIQHANYAVSNMIGSEEKVILSGLLEKKCKIPFITKKTKTKYIKEKKDGANLSMQKKEKLYRIRNTKKKIQKKLKLRMLYTTQLKQVSSFGQNIVKFVKRNVGLKPITQAMSLNTDCQSIGYVNLATIKLPGG